jgi:hypothetical protein
MKKGTPKESDIRRAILEWLGYKRIFHYRQNSGAVSGDHNGKRWFLMFGAVGRPRSAGMDFTVCDVFIIC